MALEKINMPQLGESVTEGTISSWLVSTGDKVNKYDPIAEVLTDKVNAEVPSSFTGVIKELIAQEGDTIAVGELMCYIDIEGGDSEIQSDEKSEEKSDTETEETTSADQSMKKRYSPAVLSMAIENDIDLGTINGTGRGGRITRKDIEKVIEIGQTKKSTTPDPVHSERETAKPVKETSVSKQSV